MLNKNNRARPSYLYTILAFICFWYFYFASTFTLRPFPQLFWIGMAAISVLLAVIHNHKISKTDLYFIGGMGVLLVLSVFSSDRFGSLMTVGYYVIYYLVARMISKNCSEKTVHNMVLLFSVVHLVCLFVQVLAPDIYNAFLLPLLPSAARVEITEQMLYNKSYYGFTVQTSMCAMYLSVGAIFSALKVRSSGRFLTKIIFGVLAALFIVGVFFTVRRGSAVVALLLIAIIYFRSKGGVISKFFVVLAAILFVLAVGVENIPGLDGIFGKFEQLISNDSIMNGRDISFVKALSIFAEKPLFGHGVGQIGTALGYAWLENSYLVMLVECGLVGAIVYFIPYVSAIKDTFVRMNTKAIPDFAVSFAAYIQLMFVLMSIIENYFASPINVFLFFVITLVANKTTGENSSEKAILN